MEDIKLKAELYRLALSCGFITKKDVINWADNEIMISENPDISIIELSLSGSKKAEDIISKLKEVSVGVDQEISLKILLGLFYKEIIKDPNKIQVISTELYHLYLSLQIDNKEECYLWMMYLDDEFHLANNGIYGDVEEVKSRYIDFLKQYEKYAIDFPG
ncbi:hypothetical protein [Tepidibacter hydrothermalis]|uniref:Uncharacterized protein n=1 Tax=Tepidibacter hydrothermalis TaxID=3036126 RepID=A0ABY8ED41_9FIRM|nr:hypothetical protein [Tepidibacter hydrothermalis]WFD08775.1 hypothetical protein P4S50_10230 [Tepidibacter hydrothermalis]